MKEKKLKIIITAMSLALIGLIAVQLYWVVTVIKIEEERFETNVNNALAMVIEKIDKKETADVFIKKVTKSGNQPLIISSTNHESKTIWVGDTVKQKTNVEKTLLNVLEHKINIEVISDSSDSNVIVYSSYRDKKNNIPKTVTRKRLKEFVHQKEQVFTEVIDELVLIGSSDNVEERINKAALDSLLQNEFNNIGIYTDYNFGVLDKNQNHFVFVKEEGEEGNLKKSTFTTQLFPKDILFEPNYLSVAFPNQYSYVLKSISATLGLSIGFIILIIFIFYKTVQMLIKQKKITDIKNDLINNITHEFKTPLSTISLACEALNEPKLLSDSSSVMRYSNIISDENKRLRSLVDNLLNSAKLDEGEIEVNKEHINVNDLITKTIKKFELQIENCKGKFNLELNAETNIVLADPFHLTVIFNNIIDNAIKYNEGRPEILINTFNQGNKIRIQFSDNGNGIKKNELKNIFDSFYRIPTGNIHNVKGSGMGLHHVKKLTELNDGNVSVKSSPGVGSEFTLEFINE